MHDQTLVWNTDSKLQVTSLTARLRGFAGVGTRAGSLHVSDLWGSDDPSAVTIVAHHWALDGETLSFEAPVRGIRYRFELAPLHDVAGTIIGVSGRATELRLESGLDPRALSAAERSAGMGTWYEDLRTGLVTISEGLATLLGTPRHTMHLDIRIYDHPDDQLRVRQTIADRAGDDGYSCDHRILCADGRVRNVRERMRTIFDERGVAVARVGTLLDISDLKEREAELTELALHDSLTRLPNRASLEERLQATIARCQRNERRCAVLFIDLDDFKEINDAYGHDVGDRVLVGIGERLTRHVRASDTVARFGGDEFVVLIDDLFTDEAALDAGRKILCSLDDPFTVDGRSIAISASIGIATYPRCSSSARELVTMADHEMYSVKRNGGSGIKLACSQEETVAKVTENGSCAAPYSMDQRHFATLGSG